MAKLPPKFDANGKQICGAKNRAGNPCGKHPAEGRDRCRLHGGASLLGIKNAQTTGIYTKDLTSEEMNEYGDIKLGSVDDEIRLAKIRLARALKAEAESKLIVAKACDIESISIDIDEAGAQTTKKVFRAQNFQQIIDRCLGRIESLEKTRAELIEKAKNNLSDGVDNSQITGITVSIQGVAK